MKSHIHCTSVFTVGVLHGVFGICTVAFCTQLYRVHFCINIAVKTCLDSIMHCICLKSTGMGGMQTAVPKDKK